MDFDGVIVKKFDRSVAMLSPEKFIKDFLIDQLKVKKVFVGYDFAFGKGRTGSISMLKKMGLEVHAVAPFTAHGHLVKSSTIRSMIATGEFNKAVRLLGHPYILTGKVVRGKGRGAKLGFPTANIEVAKDKLVPAHGVYAGKSQIQNPKSQQGSKYYKCVMNIGSRPTFGEEKFAIEVHIPGFHGNLRGRTIQVELFKRLRDEIHFSDVEKLKAQIGKDVRILKATRFI